MKKTTAEVGKTTNPTSLFISTALDMSWRLAIVVLVPIIGGFELDQRFHLSPILTIVGFLIAMSGTGVVMWSTLRATNDVVARREEKHT